MRLWMGDYIAQMHSVFWNIHRSADTFSKARRVHAPCIYSRVPNEKYRWRFFLCSCSGLSCCVFWALINPFDCCFYVLWLTHRVVVIHPTGQALTKPSRANISNKGFQNQDMLRLLLYVLYTIVNSIHWISEQQQQQHSNNNNNNTVTTSSWTTTTTTITTTSATTITAT